MTAATPAADAISNLAGAAMLLLGLLLPLRRAAAAARLLAVQGGALALAAAAVAWGGAGGGAGGAQLWLLALGALAGRALSLPTLLRLAAGRAGAGRAARAGGAGFLVAGGGLAMLAAAAVVPAGTGLQPGTRVGLALALGVLLTGLLAALSRRGAPLRLLGLLAAENGALLALVHAGGGAAALAVLSPGLVACAALAFRDGPDAVRGALPWALRR